MANYALCGVFDTYNFRALEMCCGCGPSEIGADRVPDSGALLESGAAGGFRCVDLDVTDGGSVTDSNGAGCTAYWDDPAANCSNYDDADFVSTELCCACFDDRDALDISLQTRANELARLGTYYDYYYLEDEFNLPPCDPNDSPACTYYTNLGTG